MVRYTRLATAICVMLTVSLSAAQAKTYYCETRRTESVGPNTKTTVSKAWEKSPTVFRIEETSGKSAVVMIANGFDGWMYDVNMKKGAHQRITTADMAMMQRKGHIIGNDLPGFLKAGAKKTGVETIDGIPCDVYKNSDQKGSKYALWVMQGPDKLTKRLESTGSIQFKGERGAKDFSMPVKNTMLVTLWQFDKPMPASLFKAPSNIKFTEAAPSGKNPAGGKR